MYIQDFPRLRGQQSPDDLPHFAVELLYFLESQGLPDHIHNKTCEYDFRKSVGIEFVHSMSGDHIGDAHRHGKNCLASAISRLDLTPSKEETVQLCYVVRNSIPAPTSNFCHSHVFLTGFLPQPWFDSLDVITWELE